MCLSLIVCLYKILKLIQRAHQLLKVLFCLLKHLICKLLQEGVETDGQRQILEELKCDTYQGYLASKPTSCSKTSSNNSLNEGSMVKDNKDKN